VRIEFQYSINIRKKDKGLQVVINYKDSNGKWKQKGKQGFQDNKKGKDLAKQAAQDILEELQQGYKTPVEFHNITFGQFWELHKEHLEVHLSFNSMQSYINAVKKFKTLNELVMKDIQTKDIQKCVDKMIKDNLRKNTIQGYLSKITTLFNAAKDQYSILNENPVKKIRYEVSKEKNDKVALTDKELELLLSKLKGNHYVIANIAAYCGLRVGEILGLTWNDIDFENKLIDVNKQWKFDKDGNRGFGELKSENSYRKVPFSDKLKTILLNYKKNAKIYYQQRLFNYKSGQGVSCNAVTLYRKAGFDISIHELRHTYATKLIANGMDFKTAASLLGHDIEQTMKTYSHVNTDMMDNAKKLIDKIF
jgi:integrase